MARIVICCYEVVGKKMAGPAIRYWEFAKALSRRHTVTLLCPNTPDSESATFTIATFRPTFFSRDLKQHLKECDVFMTQYLFPFMALHAKRAGVKILIDAYDPIPLEMLETFSHTKRDFHYAQALANMAFSFQQADAVICANEKQRDLWTGLLLGMGKISPELYDRDKTLKQTLAIVPFGLSSTPPKKTGEGPRARFSLKETDTVILWGGGIWNWFDPVTAIEALSLLKRPDVHLVFMGVKHPNDTVPEMQRAKEAVRRAKQLELLDKQVFFHFGWVPYEERQNYLLEADMGISTHFAHLETRFAFRTRMLDYLWAELPILATEGDSFADFIEAKQVGVTAPAQDPHALAAGMLQLMEQKTAMQDNIRAVKHAFHWETLLEPVEGMIQKFSKEKKSRLAFKDVAQIGGRLCEKITPTALYQRMKCRLRF